MNLVRPALRSIALVVGTAALWLSPTALADSGGLDADYGTLGRTIAIDGPSTVVDSLQLPDGSIVLLGVRGTAPSRDIFVAKVRPGGGLDAGFGSGGVLTIDAGGDDLARSISARRSGGGFVVAGATAPDLSGTGVVAKVTAGGALDASWGSTGIVRVEDGADIIARIDQAIERADGTVIYGGIDAGSAVIAGVLNDIDPWNYTAFESINVAGNDPDVMGLFERRDGTFVFVTHDVAPGAWSLVTSIFDADAPSISDITVPLTDEHRFGSVTLDDDERIVLLGGTTPSGASTMRGAMWRLTPTGARDTTFGVGGEQLLAAASEPWHATGMARDASGMTYIAGALGTGAGRTMRLTPSMLLDPTFARGGIADRTYAEAPNTPVDVYVDGAGRPVIAGALAERAATWRIERYDYAATSLDAVTFEPTFVRRLKDFSWTYTVRNSGPDSTSVAIDVTTEPTFEEQRAEATLGSAQLKAGSAGAVWTIPTLGPGSAATLTLHGKPGEVGTFATSAQITSQGAVRVGSAPNRIGAEVTVYGAATPRDDVIYATPEDDVIDALAGNDIVYALAGNDVVDGNIGDDRLFGEDGNDRLIGGEGDDHLDGGTGDDDLDGGPGNDELLGRAGHDRMSGGDGNDRLDGGDGNDRIAGGAGNDELFGRTGNDRLDGGAGNDVVDGGPGHDIVLGGLGNDRLYGRAGNDKLNSGPGNDLVFGGPGNDIIRGGLGADRLYGETGNDYLIAQGDGDKLYGGPGRDRLDGGSGNDAIWGGTGDDWINGKAGNDYLVGNDGSDWIRGYLGNDKIFGGAGNDLLNGGAGRDIMYGGPGNDIIRADDGAGGDIIDCGTGWDIVYANPGDRIASNCEYVKYDVPAGTRY